jgi:hypothetical protein
MMTTAWCPECERYMEVREMRLDEVDERLQARITLACGHEEVLG